MKKFAAILLSLALILCFAGCGSEEVKEEAPAESGKTVLKVGASSVPHAEILEVAKPILAEKGIDLEIVVFDEYVLPNMALEQGDIDANYFQHKPYLEFFNENNNTHLVSVAPIHYEPLGIYPGKCKDLKNIPDGAKIGIPNDGSNEARALYLLEAEGVIKVDHSVGYEATPINVTENKNNVEFVEMDADKLPGVVVDLDFAVINGNYAIASGINETVVASEDKDSDSAATYANVIAVKEGNENSENVKALIDALSDQKVKDFISEKYKGSVVALN